MSLFKADFKTGFKPGLKSITLLAGLLLAGAAIAGMPDGPRGHGGPGGFGGDGHRGGHGRGGLFMRELRDLDLSETQRGQIRDLVKTSRQHAGEGHEALHDLHKRYRLAVPGSADFRTLTGQLADAESNLARSRVQQQADLRTQIYGVLSADQKKKLAEELAKAPEPRPAGKPLPPPSR